MNKTTEKSQIKVPINTQDRLKINLTEEKTGVLSYVESNRKLH